MFWIAYGIGAAIGGISHIANAADTYDYYDELVDQLKEQKKLALEDLKLDFENNKNTAFKNADRADAKSTRNENLVSQDFNDSLENLQLSQVMQGLQNTQARENIQQNKGNELSNIASTGIRSGGSLSEAVELETAQNYLQYDIQKQAGRKQQDLQLSNMLAGLNNNIAGIQADRKDAYDLRESFNEGGYQWQKYENARKQTNLNYDKALKEARNQRDSNAPWTLNYWINNLSSAASMGATIGSMVSNIQSTASAAKVPTYDGTLKNNNTMTFGFNGFNTKNNFYGTDNSYFMNGWSNWGNSNFFKISN